jgi:hypothetical protein
LVPLNKSLLVGHHYLGMRNCSWPHPYEGAVRLLCSPAIK